MSIRHFRPGQKTRFVAGEVECVGDFDVRENGTREEKYLCVQVGRRRRRVMVQEKPYIQEYLKLVKNQLNEVGVNCLILHEIENTEIWQRVGVLTVDVSEEVDSGWNKKVLTLI